MPSGSYSVVARYLTLLYGRAVTRQQVYMWWARGVANRAGEVFPEPAERNTEALPRQPRVLFDLDAVAAWYGAGVPGRDGHGWVVPGMKSRQNAFTE